MKLAICKILKRKIAEMRLKSSIYELQKFHFTFISFITIFIIIHLYLILSL